MLPEDLLRALPGVLVAALLPGYLIASLLVPRWPAWERLVAAPGLSAGLIGLLGLVYHQLHIPLIPATMLPAVAVLGGSRLLLWRRGVSTPSEGPSAQLPARHRRAVIGCALFAGALSAALLATALHDEVLPPDWDPAAHGNVVNGIVRSHDIFPTVPVPLEGTGSVRPRAGFEATVALASGLGGPAGAASQLPVTVAAVVLLPLGLAMLALEGVGDWRVAALAPLLGVGLAFPADQVILGRLPLVVDSTLVVPLVVASVRLLRGQRLLAHAGFIVAAVASIWVIHGLEALSALVIGGALMLTVLLRLPLRLTLPRVSLAAVSALAGAAIANTLTRPPAVPSAAPGVATGPSQAEQASSTMAALDPHLIIQFVGQTDLSSPVAVALVLVGVVTVFVHGRLRWALVPLALLVVALADRLSAQHFGRLWREVYPWADPDRLLGLLYFVLPLLLAAGLIFALELGGRLGGTLRRWQVTTAAGAGLLVAALLARHPIGTAWSRVFGDTPTAYLYPLGRFEGLVGLRRWAPALFIVFGAAAAAWLIRGWQRFGRYPGGGRLPAALPAVGVITAVVLVSLGAGAHNEFAVYRAEIDGRALVSVADLEVMAAMSRALPANSFVLTDSHNDAGIWTAALTADYAVVPSGFEGQPPGEATVTALQNACIDPGVAAAALQSADAVFVGARRLPGAVDIWDADCIGRLPGVTLIAAVGPAGARASAFRIVHAQSRLSSDHSRLLS
jgi:hypothetical protein